MVLYICGSFQLGYGQAPGDVNRRMGRGEIRGLGTVLSSGGELLFQKWLQKKKTQRGVKRVKTLNFFF